MGKRGPRPLPDNVLEMRGRPGKRAPRPEVKPAPVNTLRPPAHLSPAAKRAWKALAPGLYRHALLTELDVLSFGLACEEYAIAMAALHAMRPDRRKNPVVVDRDKDHDDRLRRHPGAMVYRQHAAAFLAWAKEFGLTPSSRVGLDPSGGLVPPGDDDDEDEELFDG